MSASISKFHTGSKIINADTQTDIGTILHDASLKTVNGTSLVGSGDFSPLNVTLIGTTSSSTLVTFTIDTTQFKFLLFEFVNTAANNVMDSYVVTRTGAFEFFNGGNTIQFGNYIPKIVVNTNNITVNQDGATHLVTVKGVK